MFRPPPPLGGAQITFLLHLPQTENYFFSSLFLTVWKPFFVLFFLIAVARVQGIIGNIFLKKSPMYRHRNISLTIILIIHKTYSTCWCLYLQSPLHVFVIIYYFAVLGAFYRSKMSVFNILGRKFNNQLSLWDGD